MTRCNKDGGWARGEHDKNRPRCYEPCVEGSMYCQPHKDEALKRVRANMKKQPVVPDHATC